MSAKGEILKAIIDSGRKAGIEAYHGSPYDFDKFKTEAIGTGEGQQQYGRGLYFSETEDVAKNYRDSLTKLRKDGTTPVPEDSIANSYEQEYGLSGYEDFNNTTLDDVIETISDDAVETSADVNGNVRYEFSDGSGYLITQDGKVIPSGEVTGRMYKVNIDADPDELVDWDAPVGDQPKAVQEIVEAYKQGGDQSLSLKERFGFPSDPTDEQIMKRAVSAPGIIEQFKERGIKGVKYADAFTRHKPKDKRSNNYVIFDPRIIEISKKYGISIPLASAVIAGTMSPEEAQAASVGAVKKSIDEVLSQGQDAARGVGSLAGASGRTFKNQADETIARVYDNLRTQKDQYDEPVFDELPVGKLGGKTGRSGVTGVTRYRMPEGYSGSLEKLGRAAPDLIEIAPDADGAKYFSDQITSAKKANKFGASVYVYPQKKYKDMRLFITDDGSAGYALKPNGDVVSAFSSGTHKGVAQNILLHAVEQGGVKLDAFDTVLPDLYSTMGFRESGRIPWLDEEAPEDWNKAVFKAFNAGEPDVSFMAYSRDPAIPVEPRYESSYESAVEAQDRDVEDFRRSPLLNIINSGGAAGLGAGAMLSPEEAQAMGVKNIATEGIRSLGQTLEFDPRFDPRKREQEGLQSLRADFLPRNEQIIKPPLRLSDLEGEDFVTSMSDRTRAGGMIIGINDVPLYRAVDLRGGQDFMFENPNQVWASARVPSEKILEMAREFQGQSGKDPIFIPWRMAPTGGDFSNMVGELMLGFASSNMNKTTKKAFDAAVRKYRTKGSMDKGVRKNAGLKIKEWPGVDDPRAVEIWRSTPDAVRKELMNMMDVNFRNKGGLSIGAARLAASDPTQLMSQRRWLTECGQDLHWPRYRTFHASVISIRGSRRRYRGAQGR